MTSLITAGKMIAAVAARRAFQGHPLRVQPEELLNDPNLERQGSAAPEKGASEKSKQDRQARKGTHADPGNPNDLDYDNQDPGQEQAGHE